jgi:hypothetical protein
LHVCKEVPLAIEWLVDYPILFFNDDRYSRTLAQFRRQQEIESTVRVSVRRLTLNAHFRIRHRFPGIRNQSSTELDLLRRRQSAESNDDK